MQIDDETEKEKDLIESFTNLSLNNGKEVFRSALGNRKQLKRLVHVVKTENLNQMRDAKILDFWFIALKMHYPRELFRLYEMNRFLLYHRVLIGEKDSRDLVGSQLAEIYRTIVVQIDPTIFYPVDFVDNAFDGVNRYHGNDSHTTVDYFSRFLFKVGHEDLYTRIIDPLKDDRILQKMSFTSLNNYYNSARGGNYRRLNQYGHIDRYYTVRHVADRAILYYTVVALFNEIRKWYKDNEMASDRELDVMQSRINEQFDAISRLYKENTYRIKKRLLKEAILPYFKVAVEKFVNENMAMIDGRNKDDHYSTLFADIRRDDQIELDRLSFSWLLPFDAGRFRDKRITQAGISREQAMNELRAILVQESILWINMLIYEIHIADLISEKGEKKRSNEESDSDSDDPRKRVKIGRTILMDQTSDDSSILSVLHGEGVLSVYFKQGKRESYRVSAGDNIRIPYNAIDYHVLFDDH